MSRDMNNLIPEFRKKVEIVLNECKKRGIVLRPFYTLRGPYEQAKLWRQSRPKEQIESAINTMKSQGAEWLSSVLNEVGPQYGRWATNSLPGLSWHQFGEAVDCFVFDEKNNSAIWSAKDEGYKIYAQQLSNEDLVSGYYWKRKDAVHAQMRSEKVRHLYSWEEIDKMMKEKFS